MSANGEESRDQLNAMSVRRSLGDQRVVYPPILQFGRLDAVVSPPGQGTGYFDDVLVPVHTVGARARL